MRQEARERQGLPRVEQHSALGTGRETSWGFDAQDTVAWAIITPNPTMLVCGCERLGSTLTSDSLSFHLSICQDAVTWAINHPYP